MKSEYLSSLHSAVWLDKGSELVVGDSARNVADVELPGGLGGGLGGGVLGHGGEARWSRRSTQREVPGKAVEELNGRPWPEGLERERLWGGFGGFVEEIGSQGERG